MLRLPCVNGVVSGVPGVRVGAVLGALMAGCSPSMTSTEVGMWRRSGQ